MPGNSFGEVFRVTTFGESHGVGLGCIIDGVPAGIELDLDFIAKDLARRRPGQSKVVTQRQESDDYKILSGVFEGVTTGTPIALTIDNIDQKTKDYTQIKDKFRPGHGDYTYFKKYGVRDYRGGGRASARETVARVAAGSIAKSVLQKYSAIKFSSGLIQIGEIKATNLNLDNINNDFNFTDSGKVADLENYIYELRRAGDSIGAKVRLELSGVPVGLGEPVFDKLNADLAKALMSINAVKAIEIGDGVDFASMLGSAARDEMADGEFLSNHAGGILAGISTGQNIKIDITFKPAASIRLPGKSMNVAGENTSVVTIGRHDVCVAIRAPVICEAMAAITILDHYLRQRGQNGNH